MGPTTVLGSRARRATLLAALVALQACASAPASPGGVGTVPADSLWVNDELYFGALIPTGGEVSDAMWETFLDTEVTPRFPEGLTTLNGTGRYRYRNGEIKTERGWILKLLYRPDAATEAKVIAIAEAYKKAFSQESVLRVTSRAAVKFFYD